MSNIALNVEFFGDELLFGEIDPQPQIAPGRTVSIYSDGACLRNPGPGGWAAIIVDGTERIQLSGGEVMTTNNRMELQSAIEALRFLPEACSIEFFTDSRYLKDGITKWVPKWMRRGWHTKGKTPVKNRDLWEQIHIQTQRHRINWNWVKGHSGNSGNEACDQLAKEEAIKQSRS
jgi:ribonuclease HI